MFSIRGILQAVLTAVGFLAGHDLATEVGFDWQSPAFWGDVFGVLAAAGLTFGLSKDRFVSFITFGLATVRKWDESDLPNGCVHTSNLIVADLRDGVPPDEVKPRWDRLWETVVAETRPASAEGFRHA